MAWNSQSKDVIIAALVIVVLGCVLMCALTYVFAKRNYNMHMKRRGIKATKGHKRFDDSQIDENVMNVETPPASGGEFLGANSIEMTGIESRTGLRTHNIADNDGDISAMTTKSNADDDAHQHAMLRAPSPGPMRGDADGLQSVGALPPTSPSLGGRGVRGEDVMGAAHGRNGSQMHFPAKGGNGRRDPTTSEQDMQQVEEALFA